MRGPQPGGRGVLDTKARLLSLSLDEDGKTWLFSLSHAWWRLPDREKDAGRCIRRHQK